MPNPGDGFGGGGEAVGEGGGGGGTGDGGNGSGGFAAAAAVAAPKAKPTTYTRLFSKNEDVDRLNMQELRKLQGTTEDKTNFVRPYGCKVVKTSFVLYFVLVISQFHVSP